MIGQTISHYKILEKLGEGGMGVVYKAKHLKLDSLVALKFLPPHMVTQEAATKRFIRDARVGAALDHSNICSVYDIGETPDGQMFIVMAYIEGQSLRERIESGPLTLDETLNVALDVARGLQEAHEKGVVHRDIKSANIMVTKKGQAKIIDFGLAKLAGSTRVTRTGTTVGTAAYMSPEQTRGDEVDHRTDIWSLGVVIYEMLAGRLPFKGDYEQAVAFQIVHENPEPIAALRTDVPVELERIVNKCLEKKSSDRYQHVDEVLADLLGEKRAPSPKPVKNLIKYGLPGSVVLIAASVLAILNPFQCDFTPGPRADLVKLAVLPFVNLGPPEDEYFADGITDEIISRLAVIKGLAVISRTSSMQYKKSGKGLPEIGQELGVEYILEGTIRWDKAGETPRVRITPQLISVSDDFHLWAQNYEREIEEIFAVQADIASQIAEVLDITLLESERETLEARPTENPDAYQAYLRGLDYARRGTDSLRDDLRMGIQMLERAVALDPDFALGYAALSKAHSLTYHRGLDRTEERLSRARAAVDRALELQPGLPEAHLALGRYYYDGYRDYERALEALANVEKEHPNDSRILRFMADISRRQGRFEAAIDRRKRAFELSPQEAVLPREIAWTYRSMRKYSEADHYNDVAISLAPDQQWAYGNKAYNYVSWLGDTKRARDTLEKMPGKRRDLEDWSLDLWRMERNYQAILGFALSDSRRIAWWQTEAWMPALSAARAYRLMGEAELAYASYDSARVILEKELDTHEGDYRIHSALGITYAGLGRREDAIREGKRGVELCPVSKDALIGPVRVRNLAAIYTMVGEYDAALDEVEYLLSIPNWWSVYDLQLDPEFDPLRDHPRYPVLLERYAIDGL